MEIAVVASALIVATASNARADTATQQRTTLLADSLVDKEHKMLGRGTGWVVGGLGVAVMGIGTYAALLDETGASRRATSEAWISVGTGGVLALGGFGSYLVDEDYYATVLASTSESALGVQFIAWDSSEPNAAWGISAGAFFGDSALRFVDAAIQRPISRRRLSRRYRSIWRPDLRENVTEETLEAIERDFRRSSPAMSPWLLHAPLLVGAAADFAMLARSDYEAKDRYIAAGLGGVLLIFGGAFIVGDETSGWNRYERQLENTGFKVSILALPIPGLGLAGVF